MNNLSHKLNYSFFKISEVIRKHVIDQNERNNRDYLYTGLPHPQCSTLYFNKINTAAADL